MTISSSMKRGYRGRNCRGRKLVRSFSLVQFWSDSGWFALDSSFTGVNALWFLFSFFFREVLFSTMKNCDKSLFSPLVICLLTCLFEGKFFFEKILFFFDRIRTCQGGASFYENTFLVIRSVWLEICRIGNSFLNFTEVFLFLFFCRSAF